MDEAAKHLHVSISTLRRKLKAQDVTYESLVDKVRKRLAEYLMINSELKSEEVAYRLGYKHPSNFYAAFKNWFGCSTKEYRSDFKR